MDWTEKGASVRRFLSLDDTELVRARHQGLSFAPHYHETWSIGWVVEGENEFSCERRQHAAGANTVCVVNPGDVHTGGGQGFAYLNVQPGREWMAGLFTGTDLQRIAIDRAVIEDQAAVHAVSNMVSTMWVAEDDLQAEEALTRGLTTLFSRAAALRPDEAQRLHEPHAVRKAKELIEASISEKLSLAELASAAGLSMFHFCRVFQASEGMGLSAYMRNRRIIHARAGILAGLPLSEVAYAAGFSDQSHMTRTFRSVLGLSPGQLAGRQKRSRRSPKL